MRNAGACGREVSGVCKDSLLFQINSGIGHLVDREQACSTSGEPGLGIHGTHLAEDKRMGDREHGRGMKPCAWAHRRGRRFLV